MSLSFEPKFHRKVSGPAGDWWELTAALGEQGVHEEKSRLVAAGCVVVWPAGKPGTGFKPRARDEAPCGAPAHFMCVAPLLIISTIVLWFVWSPLAVVPFIVESLLHDTVSDYFEKRWRAMQSAQCDVL